MHTCRVLALKRYKNDASEVKEGYECGISLTGYNDLKNGDIIENFINERLNHPIDYARSAGGVSKTRAWCPGFAFCGNRIRDSGR